MTERDLRTAGAILTDALLGAVLILVILFQGQQIRRLDVIAEHSGRISREIKESIKINEDNLKANRENINIVKDEVVTNRKMLESLAKPILSGAKP